ncbi:glutamine amidotransferase [Vibrio hannami]|uniref:glutamine amidotransferase n=1 Tax=Vibrio hannami TaxID=2717094 RepID=UPI002410B012|nr:glutamine amidotransferase [Vibrio hannami]MDG3086967.1 glutamine amidotransferase [Vibrio hannami]
MKKIYIVNVGHAHQEQIDRWGDFEAWASKALTEQGIEDSTIELIDGVASPLPKPELCTGIIIMGSLSMVTEKTEWMLRLSQQIVSYTEQHIPMLGICFGHQLIAQALGGNVGFHPQGLEAGTTRISVLPEANNDPLFCAMPTSFPAHVVHFQSVISLPEGAQLLAKNDFEPHHAFRYGTSTWGVQFHPEFTEEIMLSSLEHLKGELSDNYQQKLAEIEETRFAKQCLFNFANYALEKSR